MGGVPHCTVLCLHTGFLSYSPWLPIVGLSPLLLLLMAISAVQGLLCSHAQNLDAVVNNYVACGTVMQWRLQGLHNPPITLLGQELA